MHEGFTTSLILIEYLTVILSGIGLFLVAKIIYRGSNSAGQTAMFGALLIITGGLCNATSQLLGTLNNSEHDLLSELLWLLKGPGYTLVFAAVLQWSLHASHKAPKALPALMAVIVLSSAIGLDDSNPENLLSFFILLAATVVFFSGVIIVFIGHGIRKKLYFSASLLILSLCMNLVTPLLIQNLNLFANFPWLTTVINTATQLSFAAGMWLIYNAHLKDKKKPH
ncbi:MAG: hypothetical protein ACJA0M_001664 [Chitinophagales bacterium]|jgi:hypothetical protein